MKKTAIVTTSNYFKVLAFFCNKLSLFSESLYLLIYMFNIISNNINFCCYNYNYKTLLLL